MQEGDGSSPLKTGPRAHRGLRLARRVLARTATRQAASRDSFVGCGASQRASRGATQRASRGAPQRASHGATQRASRGAPQRARATKPCCAHRGLHCSGLARHGLANHCCMRCDQRGLPPRKAMVFLPQRWSRARTAAGLSLRLPLPPPPPPAPPAAHLDPRADEALAELFVQIDVSRREREGRVRGAVRELRSTQLVDGGVGLDVRAQGALEAARGEEAAVEGVLAVVQRVVRAAVVDAAVADEELRRRGRGDEEPARPERRGAWRMGGSVRGWG